MIVVIQCAAKKRQNAGCLVSASGKPIIFVANPDAAPSNSVQVYARPDDKDADGTPWREVLRRHNSAPVSNPLGLSPAWQLYSNGAYAQLVEAFGMENVYILSAGWGLIHASFLTPYYDITFSRGAEAYKRRRVGEAYEDFCSLSPQTDEEIVFFGGKDYVPLFCLLTQGVPNRKTIFHNSVVPPNVPGCILKRFVTSTRTNWHYECAKSLMNGSVTLG